jgi:regulatory protein
MGNAELQEAELTGKELTRARNAAYRLLTYRPRSQAELEAKLRDKGFDDAIVQQVIDGLVRLGYVNDRKFAEQWAASRSRLRSFGRHRIELELRNKGVDRDVITEALACVFLDDLELETAKQAALKKLASMKAVDRETRRRRLAGFLGRKGFSFEIIRAVLNTVE